MLRKPFPFVTFEKIYFLTLNLAQSGPQPLKKQALPTLKAGAPYPKSGRSLLKKQALSTLKAGAACSKSELSLLKSELVER